MDKAVIERLALATLYGTQSQHTQGCLVVNEAGLRLINGPAASLPVIEELFERVVIPALQQPAPASNAVLRAANEALLRSHGMTGPSMPHVVPEFRGLDYLVGAYFIIGAKHDIERVIAFLRRCGPELMILSVAAAPSYFRRMKTGEYNFGVAPPDRLVKCLREMEASAPENLRAVAHRALGHLAGKN